MSKNEAQFAWVPVKLTEAMLDAAMEHNPNDFYTLQNMWEAMLRVGPAGPNGYMLLMRETLRFISELEIGASPSDQLLLVKDMAAKTLSVDIYYYYMERLGWVRG